MVARTVAFTMLLGRLSARGAFALVPGPGARCTAARFGRRARVAMSVEAEAPAPAAEAAAEPPYVPPSMDDVVALCKRRGFVFQSSEVYNGFNGFYDFGPLGAELKAQLNEAYDHKLWAEQNKLNDAMFPDEAHLFFWLGAPLPTHRLAASRPHS